jgi:hypothetical protein
VPLKSDAPDEERKAALFAINESAEGDNIFVVQKTKRGILSNGSAAVNKFIIEKIESTGFYQNPSIITTNAKEFVDAAFNQLASISFQLDAHGITLKQKSQS